MNINKSIAAFAEKLLEQVDEIGFQLDAMGVENRVNRHNLIAYAMFGQKRLEGELDSLTAKAESEKARIESVVTTGKQYLKSGGELVAFPATYAYGLIKERL